MTCFDLAWNLIPSRDEDVEMGLRLRGDFEVWVWLRLWPVKLFHGWKRFGRRILRKFIVWGGKFRLGVGLVCRRSFLHIHPELWLSPAHLLFLFFFPPLISLFTSHRNIQYKHKHTKRIYLLTQKLSLSSNTHTVHAYFCSCESFKRWQQFKKTSKRILLAGGCSTSPLRKG